MRLTRTIPLVCAAGVLSALAFTVYGQDANEDLARRKAVAEAAEKKEKVEAEDAKKRRAAAPAQLKVYEWGVETLHWDGTPEPENPNDVPAFYYDASEVPLESRPVAEPPPRPVNPDRPMTRKPVLYFECDRDLVFDLDVKFATGKVAWMYPKPSRRTDSATAQWDSVKLYVDGKERNMPMPNLAEVPGSHWANYSRDGARSSLVIGAEHERFIFYEGTNDALPDVDVFRNARGKWVLRNYSAFAIHNVRANLPGKDGQHLCLVPKVEAASGQTPSEVVLSDNPIPPADTTPDALLKEVERAGLTEAQAGVFQRCWNDTLLNPASGCVTYRRDAKALDAKVALKITADASVSYARVGYVSIAKISADKQAELEALALKAAEGDDGAVNSLAKAGGAGAGAVRRALSNGDNALKLRLALARVLKSIEKQWAK